MDAAKAYDKCARRLKGDEWRVNFARPEEYERAKKRELEQLETERDEAEAGRPKDAAAVKAKTQATEEYKRAKPFIGVSYDERNKKKFWARISHQKKMHFLGRYELAVDAAKAYDECARDLKGDGWRVNFARPEEYKKQSRRKLNNSRPNGRGRGGEAKGRRRRRGKNTGGGNNGRQEEVRGRCLPARWCIAVQRRRQLNEETK